MTTATLDRPAAAEPRRIRASIDERALKRVTNFFNGTALDIMTELFQNARRAGATRIDVETSRNGFSVSDNGRGIADPAVLLRFGGSEWDTGTIVREDAAGMGVYSLAGMRSRITSRTRGPETDWTVELAPADYRGERTVEVLRPRAEEAAMIDGPHGTVIDVSWRDAAGAPTDYGQHDYRLWTKLRDDPDGGREDATRSAAERAGEFLPIPVHVNGDLVKQRGYLDGVVRTVTWRGLRIGVSRKPLRDDRSTSDEPDQGINVFGHVIEMELPKTQGLEHVYGARIDVMDCRELKIVLPARKEVVQTGFIQHMKDECERTILDQMARDGAATSFAVHQAGRMLGLDMAEPPMRVAEWGPPSTDGPDFIPDYTSDSRVDPAALKETAVVVERPGSIRQTDAQLLAWAQENGDAADGARPGRMRLLAHDERLAGYPEYDRLWRIVRMEVLCRTAADAGALSPRLHPDRMSFAAYVEYERRHPDGVPQILPRAKSIVLKLELERRTGPGGAVETRTDEHAVPFAFASEEHAYPGSVLLTEDAERHIGPGALTQILFDAYYKESPGRLDDDEDINSFTSEMRNIALVLMADDDDRRREMIGDGTLDAARSYAPHDRETVVRMRWNAEREDFDIDIAFEAKTEETAS